MTNLHRIVLVAAAILFTGVSLAPAATMVHHWTMDEGSGVTATDSAGSISGTLSDGASFTASGQVSGAIDLDGSTGHVALGDDVLPVNDFSITAWIKANSLVTASDDSNVIFAQYWGGDGRFLFDVREQKVDLFNGGGGRPGVVSGSTVLDTDTWYHVALTVDASGAAAVYLNGDLEATASGVAVEVGSAPSDIGSSQAFFGSFGYFDGKIDDVRVYDGVLSQADVQALVPEPASIGLVAVGGVLLLNRKRQRAR